ncbi:MAG: serine/threonine protein kinase [Acidobacteria bacterium]|nr:serine/threonine protein kinase [Acidobacteriota bacterium]MBI3423435.1 serine/threonine protein kinase [Acidobacteriota bacterium]
MTPERYAQINQLFNDALALAADQRAGFLRQASAGDEELQRQAERLLAAHEQAEGFLEPAALADAARVFYEVLQVPTAQRADFLQKACGGSAALQQAVERMLQGREKVNGLLDQPDLAALAQAAVEAEPDPLCGQQLGHYEIIRRIGAGGMGEVYLARDFALDRQVALKILPLEFTRDPDRLHRFAREAKAASALNHPNIITIYEIGVAQTADGELHFIATEFIEGQTLRQRQQAKPLSIAEALDAAIQTAAALNAAHQAGIIHRDIKPENLMLRPDGYLKVLDFGLARINKATAVPGDDSTTRRFLETHPGVVMGTLAYMSPEQARGERVDGRTDLWSLGVVLYELLAGTRPFTAATLPDLMVALLDREPAPLAQHLPDAAPELAAAVQKALAKDTVLRFQSAQEFGQALKELRRSVDEAAAPAPVRERAAQLSDAPTRTFAKQPAVAEIEEAETLPAAPKATQAQPVNVSTQPIRAARRWHKWLPLALVLALGGGLAAWRWLGVAPAREPAPALTQAPNVPERSLRYWLTVQKVRNEQEIGPPLVATSDEPFENDWKFRFGFSSPQDGYVYAINEGPGERGQTRLIKLFPWKDESAQLPANAERLTGNNNFDQNKGTEKIWLVWAKSAMPVLDAVKTVIVSDPAQAEAIRQFLSQHEREQAESVTDPQSKQTTLRGRGETLVKAILLKHQ